jgi:pimeloyl-ACP methyl ester carboxylesterase
VVTETDLALDDGRTLHVYDADTGDGTTRLTVFWQHGAQDRLVPSSHATWLAQRCRTAELWLRPDDGHVSILSSSVMALDWLREHASP